MTSNSVVRPVGPFRTGKKGFKPAGDCKLDRRARFSPNEELLQKAGVRHRRNSEGDLETTCPICRGKLLLHPSQPWHFCLNTRCRSRNLNFSELFEKGAK